MIRTYPQYLNNNHYVLDKSRTLGHTTILGTGGHTKSIKLYENGDLKASGTWTGYQHDWQNITITPSVTLKKGLEYRYVIETGSYPQIIHVHNYTDATGGTITCDKFTDVNGKIYTDWIPAIKLWS